MHKVQFATCGLFAALSFTPAHAQTLNCSTIPGASEYGTDISVCQMPDQSTLRWDCGCRQQGETSTAKTFGLPSSVPARFSDCGRGGQDHLCKPRRRVAAGQGVRPDSRTQVRLRDQRTRNSGARLPDGTGQPAHAWAHKLQFRPIHNRITTGTQTQWVGERNQAILHVITN
jgi:hypothetical protein